jgi:hypothetical protein
MERNLDTNTMEFFWEQQGEEHQANSIASGGVFVKGLRNHKTNDNADNNYNEPNGKESYAKAPDLNDDTTEDEDTKEALLSETRRKWIQTIQDKADPVDALQLELKQDMKAFKLANPQELCNKGSVTEHHDNTDNSGTGNTKPVAGAGKTGQGYVGHREVSSFAGTTTYTCGLELTNP